jgi:transcriptional regulator of heat shock response
MERVKLSVKEQEKLRGEVLKLQAINAEVGRRLAKLLANHSTQASFAILPEEVSSMGLSNILDSAQMPAEDAKEIAQFFDTLDEHAAELLSQYGDKDPQVFVGKELSLSKNSDYSMVVSGLKLPSGKHGVVGLIGPKSMKYQKNLSLLEYITKLLGGGAALLLFIIIR